MFQYFYHLPPNGSRDAHLNELLVKLENVPVSHGCLFESYGPTGEVSLLYHAWLLCKIWT